MQREEINTGSLSYENQIAILYIRFKPIMLDYARFLVSGNICFEEDLVHDIFVKLLRREEDISWILSLEDYLFCAVRNWLINDKKRNLARMRMYNNFLKSCGTVANITEETIYYNEARRHLAKAVSVLPHRTACAFLLKEENGFSLKEISMNMEISISTVKSHLAEARKSLKRNSNFSA